MKDSSEAVKTDWQKEIERRLCVLEDTMLEEYRREMVHGGVLNIGEDLPADWKKRRLQIGFS